MSALIGAASLVVLTAACDEVEPLHHRRSSA
jgi:hypothetical protein